MLGLALYCGSFVEEAAKARHMSASAHLMPQAVTPLSASFEAQAQLVPVRALGGPMPGYSCAPQLSLAPRPGALIALTLDAPCAADQRIEIAHAGLRFAVSMPVGRPLLITLPLWTARARSRCACPTGARSRRPWPCPT